MITSAIKSIGTILLVLIVNTHCYAGEKEGSFPHPWQQIENLNVAEIDKLKDAIVPVLSMEDQKIKALIPARRPIESDLSELGDEYSGGITWTPEKPDYLSVNGIAFIPEEKFPLYTVENVEGQNGVTWRYEYVLSGNSKKIYITSLRDWAAREWFCDAAYKLAQLYTATGEFAYARKAAVIIAAFSQVAPSYVVYGKSTITGNYTFFNTEPYPDRSGKWGTWYPQDVKKIEPLVLAYDLILPSKAVAFLSSQWGRDVKNDIENNFFLGYSKLMEKYDNWHANTLSERTHNIQPFKFRGMIAIGRTIERPDLIHYAFSSMQEMITKRFGSDGVFPESPSYHQQVVGYLQVALDYLKGYCDPPEYIDSRTKRRFDHFDPATEFPTFEKAIRFRQESSFPDGTSMSVHDTWINRKSDDRRNENHDRIWPSWGHAVLGRGRDKYQMEAHIDYGYDFSHRHNDTLNLTLWACQEELLSDIGYTYTYRGWATGSLSHNLVVVDGMVQHTGTLKIEKPEDAIGGAIRTWAPVFDGFGVIEAEDINSYPQCSTYRRAVILIEDCDEHAFIVDIFDVAGGNQHDFMAHGSADKHQTLVFNKENTYFADSLAADGMIHVPASYCELPNEILKQLSIDKYGVASQYWGNIRKVGKVSGPGPWEGVFSGESKMDSSLKMHLLAPIDCEIYSGEAPSIRQADEDPSKVENYMMPILTARKKGINLSTRYIVVWEPFKEKSWIKTVKLRHNTEDGVIIFAETANTAYSIFWTPTGETPLLSEDIYFNGRFGVLRYQSGSTSFSGVDTQMIKTSDFSMTGDEKSIFSVVDAGADKNGAFLKISENCPDDQEIRWGILCFPNKHTRAILVGPIEQGNLVRCPQGHDLTYNAENKSWSETQSPCMKFNGTPVLRLIKRTHQVLSQTRKYNCQVR